MTRVRVALKSLDDYRESLEIELEVDRARKLVTLHLLEFEAEMVADFLVRGLPSAHGIRVMDSPLEPVQALPRHDLVIALAGRRHPARLAHFDDGRVAIRLLDPDAAYLARCETAIVQLLSKLHQRGIEAVVAGIDDKGRPVPDGGFLHLLPSRVNDAQEADVHQLCREVGKEYDLDICPLLFSRPCGDAKCVVAREPHFAWDAAHGKMVRRNWSGGE